ncbi:MAG TPA: protein kinase [Terriglobales bacterium]|jgi:predicted ATPase
MLTTGAKLGAYEIAAPLGTGGMGEVYRARDTRLGRSVAIKILPAAFSVSQDRLQRFEQEARSASALNHPNIVTIHELGRDQGTRFIVMELVEGKTLRQILFSGPLPMRRSIEVAAQLADGLTKAHEAGIVHRDLKPENVMISDDGFVKILDFGLAKLASSSAEPLDQVTMLSAETHLGQVVGTEGYMSPEQASASPLDFRSDQFAFGLILYEIVTGRRAFHRKTAAETREAILREHPEPAAKHNRDAPAPLCWVIERCLAKQPDGRYAATRELARELVAIRDRFAERSKQPAEMRAVNLPVQRTGFVGREKEVASAQELLLRPEVRLLTITGPGGIGKTRLAIQVAGSLADRFPGGVHFVPLSPLNDPGMIASAIVQTLGIRESSGESPLQALKESFDAGPDAPLLLVLDNFEHLMEAAPMAAELLAMARQLKIMVTSRAALHVYGENEFPAPPLALPDGQAESSPAGLLQSPAVALFAQRAAAARPDFELNQDNAAAVAEICARLDGLPLAIELAAARVKVLSPSSMLGRLSSRLQLLTGGARDLPQRQQTLRAAMDWSYDLLTPAEQKLFRRLSAFAGGCSLEAAEAVCDASGDLQLDLLEGIGSIVDKSLVQQSEGDGESRFVILETIREYGIDKLRASGEESATRRAHAAYYLVLAEEEAAEMSGTGESLACFVLEHDNFRAALHWLSQCGDADWGLRLGAALFRFWESKEYLAEGRAWLDKLLGMPGGQAPSKLRSRVLFAAGVLAGAQGDYAASEGFIQECLQFARRSGDRQTTAVCLNALAVGSRDRGDVNAARSLFEQSLAMWRELGDRSAVARSLSNLANSLQLQGNHAQASALYSECLSIFHELGDRNGLAWSLDHQGDVAREGGDLAGARSWYEQGLEIFRELGDRWGIAGTLADLGNLAREEQNYQKAHTLYGESLRIFQELDHKRGIARLLEALAGLAAAQGEAERSLRLAGAAAALRHNVGAPLAPAELSKLESALAPARSVLGDAACSSAWLEGWAMPFERAMEVGMMREMPLS